MKPAKTTVILASAAAMTLIAGCGSTPGATASALEFESIDALYQAVDESADCDPAAPEAPDLLLLPGDVIGESKMCTSTVIVTWFEDQETTKTALQKVFSPEANGGISIEIAEGGNWTVADLAEVTVGATPPATDVDLEKVASDLGGSMVANE